MKRLILVDGNSLMYRAYFGMINAKAMTNSKGIYTNATYAFARMMNHLTDDGSYDAILVAFDAGKKTFRHEFMTDYKAGRSPMPDEMRMQIAYIKEFLDLKRIKRYEVPLYEADDIIGTLSKQGEEAGYHVDVYSSDKDLLQLISDNTTVHLTKKGMTELEDYTPEHFFEVYDIPVSSFIDLKALMGDKSDNIPGVPGIGEKKAIKYLKEYANIETLLEHKDEIKGADHDKFVNYDDQARLCKKMATILREAPIEVSVSDTLKKPADDKLLYQFYEELEFHSFLKEIGTKQTTIVDYRVINNEAELKDILLDNSSVIAETANYNYHKNPLLCIGINNAKGTFIIEPNLFKTAAFKSFMEADNNKLVYDYKRIYVALRHYGIITKGVSFDLLLATYVLNSKVSAKEFRLVADFYGSSAIPYEEEIYGKGAKRAIPELGKLYHYVATKAMEITRLYPEAMNKLNETEQAALLTEIEIPLSYVLGKLEFNGMKIDIAELDRQDLELTERTSTLEKEIYELAGFEFNISSPKQLAEVLFVKMNIPYPGNSKKGYSTEISILEAIKDLNPIVNKVIEYRQITKLYGTYIKGLREQIFPDNKVHTIFEQALTETGRLSSIEPNLQNIPIRTEQGHLIRKMFIPDNKENTFYSADYSQIELRVLAHMAEVKHLTKAFKEGEDVHTSTAKLIFGHDDVTSLERRKAKAVNFGIVYGISAYGLANDLDIPQYEAKEFIEKYKQINPEVDEFMTRVLDFCKENGYVKTLKNRRRYIPDINSKNYMQREFAKRMAMNAPIQGSAADIIKMAMIEIDRELESRGLKSKMLVQVHDELVFEVSKGEEEIIQSLVRDKMTHIMQLAVPLEVADSFGDNWYLLK